MMQKAKFIEFVRKNPILYDISHDDFKNCYKKDIIWDEIGREFNESGDELKKKWKSLRDTYAKYIKRTQNQEMPKKWIWAEHMRFFRPFLSISKTNPNNTFDQQEYSDSDDQLIDSMADAGNDNEYIISETDYMAHDNQPVDSIVYVHDSPATSSFPDNSIRPQTTFSITEARSLKRKYEDEPNNATTENYNDQQIKAAFDDTECLLLAHAKTIKKFSAKRQAVTKYKIAQVILEQELLHIQESSPPHKGSAAIKKERQNSGSSEFSYGDN